MVTRLGDVCTKIGSGATPKGGKSSYLDSGPFALVRSQNIHNHGFEHSGLAFISEEQASKLDGVAISQRDVLLNITGDSVARVCQVPEDLGPARVNQHVAIIRPDPEVLDPQFLRYYLVNAPVQEHMLALASVGATRPALTKSMIENFEIQAPEIAEQREIASILGALDDKIELNRRMAATLEDMARALYRSWFVDFDPVKAKADGLAPAFMDEATAALFPDRFGDDGLPEGWRRRPIGELIGDTIGGDWGKEVPDDLNNMPVCIIRGTDMPGIMDGGTAGVPTRYTSMKKVEKRVLRPFDIVLEVSGGSPTQPTGRTLLITEAELSRFDHAMVPASFCRRLRPVTEPVGMIAFLHAQQLYLEGGTWNYQNQSTGISNFQTPRFLQEEMVALPNDDTVINAFYSFAKSWISKARSNENIKLSALRDTLLPKLMSGELRVGEAQDLIEEVA